MSVTEDEVSAIAGLSGPPEDKKKRPSGKRASAPRVSISIDKIETELARTFGFVGVFVYARDQTCGTAIIEGTADLAKSLRVLAEQNKSVRRVLEKMITGGAWSGVALAGASIAIPILRHHNLIPSNPLTEPVPIREEKKEEPFTAPQPEKGEDGDRSERIPADLHPMGPIPGE